MLAVIAAWSALWGPWAKRRAAAAADRKLREETHQALYGIPARRDDSGALIAEPKAGLIAGFELLTKDVAALRKEFPVNGIPARTAIDAVNQNVSDLRRDIREHVGDREAHLR